MAPRKTAVKEVKSAQAAAIDFDFDAFLAGFQHPEFTASLIRRADLGPKLAARAKVLDELDEQIGRLETAEGEDGQERDITAVNPLATLTERRNRLTLEYNDIANEYNDSAVSFTFRVPDKKDDAATIQALMVAAGAPDQPERPDTEDMDKEEAEAVLTQYTEEFGVWWDLLAIRSMSVTCIEHPGTQYGAPPLTIEQWEALRDRVGAVAFNTLGQAWFEAVQAVAPAVPFSPRPLPTPATGG